MISKTFILNRRKVNSFSFAQEQSGICFPFSPVKDAFILPDYLYTESFASLQIREAQLAQYNYILVVGEEESKTGKVTSMPLC